MTSVTLVTSFAPESWGVYSKRMLQTALQYLPESVLIKAYYNKIKPEFPDNSRIEFIDNYSILNGVSNFIDRHGKDQKLWGKVPGQKDNFRHNVNSFAHKSYAFYHAAQQIESGIVVWCDADVEFFSEMPLSFLDEILPYPYYACFLDRGEKYHFETGFYAVRTAHPYHQEFLERFIDFYRKDLFIREKEYHDAWLTTELVKKMRYEKKITIYNLCSGYDGSGHPWLVSRLAEFSDHKKGRRKIVGSSWQDDLKIPRLEPYWQNLPKRS